MTDNKNNATMISFSAGFNPKEILTLSSSPKGMVWKDKETKNDIIIRSPLLEVVYSPTPAPGKTAEYSMALRVHVGENKETSLKHQQMFKELSESAQKTAVEFMMVDKNGKQYAKKTFSSENEFKITKFWYDNGQFYMRFRTSVSTHLFDAVETKKMKDSGSDKKDYHIVKDDIRRYLGQKSLISVDFRPNAFFYQAKNTLYPFSPNIEKIVIWAYSDNSNPNVTERTTKKHSFLKGFALDIPQGFKLPEEIEHQNDVPIHHVNTFNVENYSLSKVIDGAKGPIIYARYGDSFGPTYFKATNVVVKWDTKPDPEFNSRSIVLADCQANQPVLKMIQEQFSKLLETVTENSEKIFGEKYDRDTVEELISNPLHSQKDVNKANQRVSLKLPREEKSDKPLFELFIIPPNNVDENTENTELTTITPIDMGETCELAEQYVSAGTVCKSLVFMTRPVIVNSQVYLSSRIEQILVDTNQKRVYTPALNGFAFPGYDDSDIESRSKTSVIKITNNFHFTNYDDKKKAFDLVFENDGQTSLYGILPCPITVAYDIGLVDDPDNNQFAYRIRFNHTNEDLLSIYRSIDTKLIEHCTTYSKEIFGSTKTEKVVAASVNKGKLEKFSKSDKDKTEPYSTVKAPVYEETNIAFEAYRAIAPMDSDCKIDIQKIPLSKKEDLMEVFYKDATILPIVRIRGSFVDKRIILSTTLAQVLIVPNNTESDIPFAETTDEDMLTLSSYTQNEFNKNSKVNTTQVDTAKADTAKADTVKDDTVKDDTVKDDTTQDTKSVSSEEESEEESESD